MERLIERPIPKPPGLVVWKAAKTLSKFPGSSPGPVSRTVTNTLVCFWTCVLMTNSRPGEEKGGRAYTNTNSRRESIRLRNSVSDINMPMDILVVSYSRFEALRQKLGLMYR
jgi:hypothetical protein